MIAFLVQPSNPPCECTFVLVISRNAERQYFERQSHGQINLFFTGVDTENFSLIAGIDLATMWINFISSFGTVHRLLLPFGNF